MGKERRKTFSEATQAITDDDDPFKDLKDDLDELGSTDATLTSDGVTADLVDFDVGVSNSNACLTDDDVLDEIIETEDAGSDDVV